MESIEEESEGELDIESGGEHYALCHRRQTSAAAPLAEQQLGDTQASRHCAATVQCACQAAFGGAVPAARLVTGDSDGLKAFESTNGGAAATTHMTSGDRDGPLTTEIHELIAEAKKKRKCHGVTAMHFVVGTLFITLIALVVTSIKVFAPQRNIYSSQPGFVFDKDSRLLTVHNSSGYPLLQIRTGVDLRGLPYNCSTADDLGSRRRCWKWSPSNVTLRVSVVNLSAELTCVGVTWVTTNVDPVLRDCITLGQLQWYGGASSRSLPWSLSAASASAGDAGAGPWLYAPGTALGWLTARSWISSSGALVAASSYTPLYVNIRGGSSPAFCLSSWYGYERGGARVLNYTACVAADVPTVHRRLVESQRAAAVWTDGDAAAVDDGLPQTTGSSFASSSTTSSATSPLTSTLPAEVAPATAISGVHMENDEAVDQWTELDSLPSSFNGDVADAVEEEPRPLSDVARGRPRWTSSVVMRDPVWHVRANSSIGNATTAAEVLLRAISSHRFAVGTFLVRDSILTDVDGVASTVASIVAAARLLNMTAPAFGLTLSAFVSVRSELFVDLRYQGLWTRSARGTLPVLVRDPAADAGGSTGASRGGGGVTVASLLVNSSSDVARELAEQGVREVVSKAGVASNNSSIAMLYLKVAVAVAEMDLDSYPPAMQEHLLAYPHWFARLGNGLSRFVARGNAAPEAAASAEGKNSGRLDMQSVAAAAASSSSPLVLVDGATTGLAGYALPEPVRRGSLADIVTHLVAASVAGDPPASIGPFTALDAANSGSSSDADAKRRYVLWLQLASFAPVVQLDVTPWSYGDDVAEQARRILDFRNAEIVPRLRRLYDAFQLSGEPVYKPLWWNDSVAAAAKASKLGTEFFLDDLLVAPMLDQKSYRLIYFPTGFWLDQGQKLYIGPGTHNVTIDPSMPPCFVRKTTGIHEPGIYDPDGDASRRRK